MFENTLAPATARLLATLSAKRWLRPFWLAGGTALALQYGHRQSVDLDFFNLKPIATRPLIKKLGQAGSFELVNEAKDTVEGILNKVKLSFITFSYPRLRPLVPYRGLVRLASPLDIALMKLGAITGRNTKKDFIDLYLFLEREPMPLRQLIGYLAKQFRGITFDRYHLYKALTYFIEADVEPMPKMLAPISWKKVRQFFIREVGQLAKQ